METAKLPAERLVKDVVEMQIPLATKAGVSVHLNAAGDLGSICGDRKRLLQVVENLIGNAIKFTPGGGSIAVSARSVDGHDEFSVSDTGRGIAADALPRVYDRFWQGKRGGLTD